MIRSMTGYGKAEVTSSLGRTIVEIRSVNHRYGEITVKLPRAILAAEHGVRKCAAERLKRGKIDVFVQREERLDETALPLLNLPLARAYHEAFVSLKEALDLDDPVSLSMIAAQKDVLIGREVEAPEESLLAEVMEVVRKAVESLDAMRLREGELLLDDLRARRGVLASSLAAVGRRAPVAVGESAARMKERVASLLGENGIDEARLAQEIAIIADKCDITEELVRFESHLQQFDETLNAAEPVGRKLDFIMQELNREANTIGSKANDAEITLYVVEMKAELEKIREQVQNIE
jgi:uncharacterized protein (TIGR00255 family)